LQSFPSLELRSGRGEELGEGDRRQKANRDIILGREEGDIDLRQTPTKKESPKGLDRKIPPLWKTQSRGKRGKKRKSQKREPKGHSLNRKIVFKRKRMKVPTNP